MSKQSVLESVTKSTRRGGNEGQVKPINQLTRWGGDHRRETQGQGVLDLRSRARGDPSEEILIIYFGYKSMFI